MLQNFKFRTQGFYVCRPKHCSKEIQVSNFVFSLSKKIDAGVASGEF